MTHSKLLLQSALRQVRGIKQEINTSKAQRTAEGKASPLT